MRGFEKPQENPMRKIPGKRAPIRDRDAARKTRNHPRQATTEQRRIPRRAPRVLAVNPLRTLPTKPPKLGEEPTHDCCSKVRFSEALKGELLELQYILKTYKQDGKK